MEMNLEFLGRVLFYIGLAASVLAGFVNLGETALFALVAFGATVGFLNVTGKEVTTFLIATIALMLSAFALREVLGTLTSTILSHFVAFVAGAALIVALREVIVITKSK